VLQPETARLSNAANATEMIPINKRFVIKTCSPFNYSTGIAETFHYSIFANIKAFDAFRS
jgi:hypothetical protein